MKIETRLGVPINNPLSSLPVVKVGPHSITSLVSCHFLIELLFSYTLPPKCHTHVSNVKILKKKRTVIFAITKIDTNVLLL